MLNVCGKVLVYNAVIYLYYMRLFSVLTVVKIEDF